MRIQSKLRTISNEKISSFLKVFYKFNYIIINRLFKKSTKPSGLSDFKIFPISDTTTPFPKSVNSITSLSIKHKVHGLPFWVQWNNSILPNVLSLGVLFSQTLFFIILSSKCRFVSPPPPQNS